MSENRFICKHYDWLQWHIYDNDNFLVEVSGSKDDAQRHCKFLNMLDKENKKVNECNRKLEIRLNDNEQDIEMLEQEIIHLEDEIDVLKVFQNEVVETIQKEIERGITYGYDVTILKEIWYKLNLYDVF